MHFFTSIGYECVITFLIADTSPHFVYSAGVPFHKELQELLVSSSLRWALVPYAADFYILEHKYIIISSVAFVTIGLAAVGVVPAATFYGFWKAVAWGVVVDTTGFQTNGLMSIDSELDKDLTKYETLVRAAIGVGQLILLFLG
jgi:hypothetical protein